MPHGPQRTDLNALIAHRCRWARLRKGYSMSRMERRTGVSADEIAAMEAGEISVSAIYVYRLAALLGRDVADFFPLEVEAPVAEGRRRPN